MCLALYTGWMPLLATTLLHPAVSLRVFFFNWDILYILLVIQNNVKKKKEGLHLDSESQPEEIPLYAVYLFRDQRDILSQGFSPRSFVCACLSHACVAYTSCGCERSRDL